MLDGMMIKVADDRGIDVAQVKWLNPLDVTIERMTGTKVRVGTKIKCPFHDDKKPSLSVWKDHWRCWACNVGGDVIDFVGYMRYGTAYDKRNHFRDILMFLGGARQETVSMTAPPVLAQTQVVERLPLQATQIDVMEWHMTMPLARRQYWQSRGLSDATINAFKLGWDGKRYTIPALAQRHLFGVKRRQSEIADGLLGKYVSIKGSRVGIFNFDILAHTRSIVICEGEIDAMLLLQYGYPAVSSTGGASSWREEWAVFFPHMTDIVVLYDNDKAGLEGANVVCKSLPGARIVHLPHGVKDFGVMCFDAAVNRWLHGNLWV